MAPRGAIVIHGHFYQPPRENPWLEAVEIQDSAAPYHDWNERVTAECYAPNTAARRVDEQNRIVDIVDNFEKISFNVGPTLMAWLERHASAVHERIVEADRASVRARGGHGNAIAQVYNHMILPLASRHDKVTQVRWGIEDFRARFGREPEGLWLPETAVDTESLEVLADAGIAFTILAPHQAARVRPIGDEAWQDVGDGIDPSRAYLWRGPGGQRLTLFFYDGPISRAIAFSGALERGERLVAELMGGFSDSRDWPQIVHCATDGESYGHHHRFGEMALAAAVGQIEATGEAELTNYGAFLAAHPPTHEVLIRENTSWSCAHGVERWRADCGCGIDPHHSHRWRAPLRSALDWLRDEVDTLFESRAGAFLKDPWAARDDYIDVVLNRSPESIDAWLARHARTTLADSPPRPISVEGRVEVARLMEMQRQRMLMYTSCGWFFDDLASLEPVQNLKYAALALRYFRQLGGGAPETELLRRLEAIPADDSASTDGADVYRRLVRPAVVGPERVVANYAITGLVEEHAEDARAYAYRVLRLDEARESYAETELRVGHVRVTFDLTGETGEVAYAVLYFGGHDFSCGVAPYDEVAYARLKADLFDRYQRHSMADVVHGLDEHFPPPTFSLRDLFLEDRRRVLDRVVRAVLLRHEETYHRIWEESRSLVHYLREVDAPLPEVLRLTARHVLEERVGAELGALATAAAIPPRVFDLIGEARALGLTLDLDSARDAMREAVHERLVALQADASPARIAEALALVEGALRAGFRIGKWSAQNDFMAIWRARPDARPALQPIAGALGFALAAAPPA
jgi:alpha-amylase/alpha-mannosidase (GH57 family)